MARLSIGLQHFHAKERNATLNVDQARICAPGPQAPGPEESKTDSNENFQQDPKHSDQDSKQDSHKQDMYAAQNHMLAMRNSELAMKNTELLSVIEDLELQVASLKHDLELKQTPEVDLEKVVSMLKDNHSQVLNYIQKGSNSTMVENLSGVVSTSTPNTSKLPEKSKSPSEPTKSPMESSLPDFSFDPRAESTPNTLSIRELSDESSIASADLAMLDDRSTDKTPNRTLEAESLENILDPVVSNPPKRAQEPDPLEYFAKRRALDSQARTRRELRLQPSRSVKVEVKSENDDFFILSKPKQKSKRKPLSVVTNNVQKKSEKDSDAIFDFVDKSELLRPFSREKTA